MTVSVDPIAIAISVARMLDGLGIVHTIGGSIASSFAGEPRSTIDIDIVAAVRESDIPALVAALSPDFYVDEGALRRAVRDRSSANVIHHTTQVKVDVIRGASGRLEGGRRERLRRYAAPGNSSSRRTG